MKKLVTALLAAIAVASAAASAQEAQKECRGDFCVGDTVLMKAECDYHGNHVGRIEGFFPGSRFVFWNPANSNPSRSFLELSCFVKAKRCAECLGTGMCLGDTIQLKRSGCVGIITGIVGDIELGRHAYTQCGGADAEDLIPVKPSGEERDPCGEPSQPVIWDDLE